MQIIKKYLKCRIILKDFISLCWYIYQQLKKVVQFFRTSTLQVIKNPSAGVGAIILTAAVHTASMGNHSAYHAVTLFAIWSFLITPPNEQEKTKLSKSRLNLQQQVAAYIKQVP